MKRTPPLVPSVARRNLHTKAKDETKEGVQPARVGSSYVVMVWYLYEKHSNSGNDEFRSQWTGTATLGCDQCMFGADLSCGLKDQTDGGRKLDYVLNGEDIRDAIRES